ncbi:hypothetical protein JCM11641_002049 [Rhodosporidiobolus odoratus]
MHLHGRTPLRASGFCFSLPSSHLASSRRRRNKVELLKMPRHRPTPLAIPPPAPAKPAYHPEFLSPDTALFAPSSSGASPNRVNNLFLKLKKSASQLRANSAPPSPTSPQPSPLLSASLFPVPPSRDETEKEIAPPFGNFAPRSPRIGNGPAWLELPASPLLPPLSATSSSFSSASSSERWPLTPNTPYTPPKESFSPSRHGKDLVFPHRPRVRPTSALLFTPESSLDKEKDQLEAVSLSAFLSASPVNAPKLAFPSPPPASPRRSSRSPAPLPPKTPPRKPTRALPTPPDSGKSSRLSPTPVSPIRLSSPGRPLSYIQRDEPLPPMLATPSSRDRPLPLPPAPKPTRIFSAFPYQSEAKGPMFSFPNGSTGPRTPSKPRGKAAAGAAQEGGATRSSTYSTFSDPDSENRSSSSLSDPEHSDEDQDKDDLNSDEDELDDDDISLYPSTPPHLFLLAPIPPPRPARSPLRPISKPVINFQFESPPPKLTFVRGQDQPPPQAVTASGLQELIKSQAESESAQAEVESDLESSVDAPAFSSCPSTPARRRAFGDSPSPSPISRTTPSPSPRQRTSPSRSHATAPPVPTLPAYLLSATSKPSPRVLYTFLGLSDGDAGDGSPSRFEELERIRGEESNAKLTREAVEVEMAKRQKGLEMGYEYDEDLVVMMEKMLWG